MARKEREIFIELPVSNYNPPSLDKEVKRVEDSGIISHYPTPEEIDETNQSLHAKIAQSRLDNPDRFDNEVTQLQSRWKQLDIKVQKQEERTAENRRKRRIEIRQNKEEMSQLWDLEGKSGIHQAMQKRPRNNPLQLTENGKIIVLRTPLEIISDQEWKDYKRINPRSKRYGLNNDLTWEQYRLWAQNHSWFTKLSQCDQANILFNDAERSKRR